MARPSNFSPRLIRQYSKLNVFDKSLKLNQKNHSVKSVEFPDVQYLKNQSVSKIINTLAFINRKFPQVLDVGSSYGHFESMLLLRDQDPELQSDIDKVRLKITDITMLDSSKDCLDYKHYDDTEIKIRKLAADEETLSHRSLNPDSFNCILTNLNMHWTNDLPGFLTRCYSLLKQESIFIGSMFALETLFELRSSLQLAEMERKGGIAPHISPYITVQDLGNLLSRAGFKMITIDIDEVVVDYPDILGLMNDLKAMGENNCLHEREALNKDTLIAADAIYKAMYGIKDPEHPDRTAYPATFRLLYFIGWKDDTITHAERGSQEVNLKEVL